eukprot:GHRR01009699.1.p1 GENE.GHRR01009699.1~~GHRR01009699.1.p1  ORF type:complete len:245 (+),score=70.96 GHRR01009699.1:688-1422(+)
MAAIGQQTRLHTHHRSASESPLPAGIRPFQSRLGRCSERRAPVVRAVDGDAELEQRLAALRKQKGATPDGEGSKYKKRAGVNSKKPAGPQKQTYDWSNETVHWEGGPAAGDLAFNIGLGATIIGLPLTIGATARSAFVRYKFTDKRVSVSTNAPWEKKQTHCAYQEVKDVRTASRGFGAWGDMVIELKNGDKLELRSLEKFKELKEYVLARRDALGGGPGKQPSIMDLDMDDDEAMKKSRKGFA